MKESFNGSPQAAEVFSFAVAGLPKKIEVTFSPHQNVFAGQILGNMAARIAEEGKQTGGSVLFAVMGLDSGTGPIFPALKETP